MSRTHIIVVIIVSLIVFIIIRKNWYKIQGLLKPRSITDPGEGGNITDARKVYLEDLANKMKIDIYGINIFGHDNNTYASADGLNDIELLYLAKYYKKYLTNGVPLSKDINEEWDYTDAMTSLANHLNKIGE